MLRERRELKKKAREIGAPYKPYWTKERIKSEIGLVEEARKFREEILKLPEDERAKFLKKQNIDLRIIEDLSKQQGIETKDMKKGKEEKKKKILLAGGGGGASVPSVSSEGLEILIRIALIGLAFLLVLYFLSSLF